MKPVAPVTNTFINRSFRSNCRNTASLKRLSDQFLTFLPERLGILWIQRITAHSFADGADGHVVRNDIADVAILAITAADLVSGGNYAGPHRSCGSLRNGLPLERRLTLCCELLIHLVYDPLYSTRIDVASQLGLDASGMHGRGAHTTLTVPPVEGNSEEDIRRLRSAVGNEGLIGRPLKVGILEIDVRLAVTGSRQVHQPTSGADKRRDAVNEHKVAQVIGAELCFKAVRCVSERCGHHARIGDDHVEVFTLCEQFVGTRAHAFEAGEIKLNEPEAPTAGGCVFSHLHGRGFGLRP